MSNAPTDEYQEYPCDLCSCNEAVEVPYARLYTQDQPIHICKQCGFVYVKRRRDRWAIGREWSNLYGKEFSTSQYTARIPAVLARQTYVADFIDSTIGLKDKALCDIGAGEGQFAQIVKQHYSARPFGVEPSSTNCQLMTEKGLECFSGILEDYVGKDNDTPRFDVATLLWTLENSYSCRDMLECAQTLLNDSGHLVIATGSRLLVPFKKPLNLYLSTQATDLHCFRFSANTLVGLLTEMGFEAVHLNRYTDSDILCVIAKKRLNKKPQWEGDSFLKVHDFFRRWHEETAYYLK